MGIKLAREKGEELKRLYKEGLSVWKIAPITGVRGQDVHKYFKEIGFNMRSKSESIRKHSLNHNIFESIDTHEKAYWLGILFADGGMIFNKGFHTVGLTLHRDDRYHLEKFKSFLGSTTKILDRADKKASSFTVAGKEFCSHLKDKGMVPAKSLILEAPKNVPTEFLNSFILGVFDGDGTLYFRDRKNYVSKQGMLGFIGAKGIMEFIAETLHKNTRAPLKTPKMVTNSTVYTVRYEGGIILKSVLKWLYKDSPVYLHRKHELYLRNIL